MGTYASAPWNISSDIVMLDRHYMKNNNTNEIISTFTLSGTNDESITFPATSKHFVLHAAEFIDWGNARSGIAGDLYYDRLTLIEQLGLANSTMSQTRPHQHVKHQCLLIHYGLVPHQRRLMISLRDIFGCTKCGAKGTCHQLLNT